MHANLHKQRKASEPLCVTAVVQARHTSGFEVLVMVLPGRSDLLGAGCYRVTVFFQVITVKAFSFS